MFKKISVVLLSFLYINPAFSAGESAARDWCATLYGPRLAVAAGRPGNEEDMFKVVGTYSRNPYITKEYMDKLPRDPRKIRDFFYGGWSAAWTAKSPFGMRFVSAAEDFALEGCADTPEGRSKYVLRGEHLGMVGFTADSDRLNTAQVFYLYEPFVWHNRVATETLDILLGQHLRALVSESVPLPDGTPLEKLSATALKDGSVYSNKLLAGLFGEPVGTVVAYGGERNLYHTPVGTVLANLEARRAEKAAAAAGTEATA